MTPLRDHHFATNISAIYMRLCVIVLHKNGVPHRTSAEYETCKYMYTNRYDLCESLYISLNYGLAIIEAKTSCFLATVMIIFVGLMWKKFFVYVFCFYRRGGIPVIIVIVINKYIFNTSKALL